MTNINYSDLPIKTGPTVSGDFVLITDSEDGDIVKIQDASLFKGPDGDPGATGSPGLDAPEVEIEFSIDGATLWHTPFASGDFYQRISTDGGLTWSNAIKFVGEDGTGIGDMLKSENLSGLANYTTARSNLGVYSTTEVNTALDLKQNIALTNLASTDINTIVTNGKYCCQSSCTNLPEAVKTKLVVNVDPTNSNLCSQEATTTTTLISYIRTTANGGTSWTAWSRIKAQDETKVGLSGNETIAGTKTFSSDVIVPAETYGTGWNGSNEVPTKNDVYDKIETLGGSSGRRLLFVVAGTIGITLTNVANTYAIDGTYTISQCNMWLGTAGSGTLTADINLNGTTIFSTTKPSITTTNQSSINTGTITTTSVASGNVLTLDIDAVQSTPGVDLYVELILT